MSERLAVLVAFALRLALGLALRPPPTWDGELYHRAAQGLVRGLGYSCFMFGPLADPAVATAYYPVGLPAWLAGFYALLGDGDLARSLAGALAGAVGAALAAVIARPMLTHRAHLAAWVVALSPGAALYAAAPMTETLWGALLAAVVALLLDAEAPSRRRVLLVGATVAAAAFVRPQALVLVPVLPWMAGGAWRVRLARTLGVALTVAALVAPWSLRNCASLDGCALISTNGAGNFAIGAVPRADGRYLALTGDDGCRGVRGEIARERCWRGVTRGVIARAPRRWIGLATAKVWHTWGYEAFPAGYLRAARPDLLSARGEDRLRGGLTAAWGVLLALALVSLLPTHARPPLGRAGGMALAALGLVTLTHALFFGGDRYHLALIPLVAPLALRAFVNTPPWRPRRWAWVESSAADPKASLELQASRPMSG